MPGVKGAGGPPPKRSTQRRRRNSPPAQKTTVARRVRGPALTGTHSDAGVRTYEALRRSRQSVFFEPSDWAVAAWAVELMDHFAEKPQAVMAQTIMSIWTSLLATEGDRRRLRVELARTGTADPDEDAAVAALDDYRSRLTVAG